MGIFIQLHSPTHSQNKKNSQNSESKQKSKIKQEKLIFKQISRELIELLLLNYEF